MGRPSGTPHKSVTAKISKEMRNPSQRNKVTSQKDITDSPIESNCDNATQGQQILPPCAICIRYYFWEEKSVMAVLATPYFSARAAIVPSSASFTSWALT